MASEATCLSMSPRLFTADMHTQEIPMCHLSVQFVPPPVARAGSTCPCAVVVVGSRYLPDQERLFLNSFFLMLGSQALSLTICVLS